MTAKVFGNNEDGESTIIIGMGRSGKTGNAVLRLRASERPLKFFVAPRVTNKILLKDMDRVDWPIESADQLIEAYNKAQEDENASDIFLIIVPPKLKGEPDR